MEPGLKQNFRPFFIKIVVPTILAITLFIVSIYTIILPTFERNMLDRKREMIRELTNSAWSILDEYQTEEKFGRLTKEEAQREAIARIEYLRYGEENKDYFWITDMHPNMIVHPYRPDLNNKDLTNFQDPKGKLLFVEFVNEVKKNGQGYVDYEWQWKDDSTKIVPKLSYVREFEPWGWIIGTGIYIEDVKQEIAAMESRMINISLLIIAAIIVILLFIIIQSLRIEKRRLKAEDELKKSRERYRKLVEASTEGSMMILKGDFIYSNKVLLDMLGYSREEFMKLYLNDIFLKEDFEDNNGIKFFKPISSGEKEVTEFITKLIKKDKNLIDVELTTTKATIGNDNGFIMVVKKLDKNRQELFASRTKYQSLTHNLEMGVFRTTLGRNGKFIESNPACLDILGFSSTEELFNTNIFELFVDKNSRNEIMSALANEKTIKNRIIKLRKNDGIIISVALSAVLTEDETGEISYCDGVIQDITEQQKFLEKQEDLMVELQTSLLFLNQPIKSFTRETPHCDFTTSIRNAAMIMSKNKISALLIDLDKENTAGLITDYDLKDRVIATGVNLDDQVYTIMSSPLISISESSLVFEAILKMREKGFRHLAVKDSSGKIVSVVNFEELMQAQTYSLSIIIHQVQNATSVIEIQKAQEKLPQLINTLINSGANTQNITRIITAVTDSINYKLIELAIKELGEPPVKFAFIVLGSEGREEQTLATDQDNAIVYEDVADEEKEKVSAYFNSLGTLVCNWLDETGYNFCVGEIMAKNPRWCQPITKWKKYFADWITVPDPKALIGISIFFDFRLIYGEQQFVDELSKFVHEDMDKNDIFYFNFAQNALQFKPPVDFFGNIRTKNIQEYSGAFDIKDAIVPLVSFARIYSLKTGVRETNTIRRLKNLLNTNAITREEYDELLVAYNYLMLMRFNHQIKLINENKKADNYIIPKKLTEIEQSMLKKTFSRIADFQKKISIKFTGKTV